MPDYPALARQGIYTLDNGMRVFAGTVDDPFYIDLGGVFDSLNLRGSFPSGTPGVLTPDQDGNDRQNFGPDYVAGYNVNTIAIEVPINQITRGGAVYPATDPRAVIGTWGTTSRPRISVRRSAQELAGFGEDFTDYRQVQRMGNPLINEVIIGTGSKDTFSMSDPKDDAQFANFVLDPLLARALNAVYGGLAGSGCAAHGLVAARSISGANRSSWNASGTGCRSAPPQHRSSADSRCRKKAPGSDRRRSRWFSERTPCFRRRDGHLSTRRCRNPRRQHRSALQHNR